jgi:glucose/arabinose dehydrogenase
VRTLGTLTGVESMSVPFGANSCYLPDGLSGIQIGSLDTPLADLATQLFDTQLPDGLRYVAFAGSTPYYLGADAIYGPGGLVVSAPELGDCQRFAVIGNNAYATSLSRHVIFKVPLDGSPVGILAGEDGTVDMIDGPGTTARFNQPFGILAAGGALYVADSHNHRIVRVALDGTTTTIAGGTYGPADGVGTQAQFQHPDDITIDDHGILYVVDEEGNRVRRIAFQGGSAVVSTVAGTGAAGTRDGTNAKFNAPTTIGWGKVGGTPVLFVGHYSDGRLRLVTNF